MHRRSMVVALVGALGVSACSDSTSPGGNTNPVASFTSSCTDLSCSFTDLSSVPNVGGYVASWHWTFGDNSTSSSQNTAHTYTVAGDFDVTLSVTDNSGGSKSITKTVTVTAAANGAPTADFNVSCSALDCTFTDQSTDNGSVVAWDWNFGDGSAHSSTQNPTHSYVATGLATYTAKLTVTDNDGLTSTKSTEFTVSPAATLQCEDAANPGQFASCDLVLDANATVSVTLESVSCTARDNAFQITEPISVTLFTDGCYSPTPGTPGASFDLNGGGVFAAGTHLKAQVLSGSTKQKTAPALHVQGSYPTWTLNFDDGEGCGASDPTCGGTEPDYNDLVIKVTATPAP